MHIDELGPQQKPWEPTRCDTNACIEVLTVGCGPYVGNVAMRSSLQPEDVTLYTPDEMANFIRAVRAGQFDNFVETATS